VPNASVAALGRDHAVAATSGVWFATLQLDGVEVPVLLGYPNAAVAPPIIAGHGLRQTNEVVLGAATLAELHLHIGDTVGLRYTASFPPRAIPLVVVGVATMPAIGIAENLHTSMATGALIPADNGLLTEKLGPQAYPGCNGPNMVFIRTRTGTTPAAALAAAQRLAGSADAAFSAAPRSSNCQGNVANVLAVQRPAQIVNYRAMGTTPAALAAGVAGGAVVALAVTLAASVRRRRTDIAVLKTLGFTGRQLAATIAWQASIAAAAGVAVGLPVGIALGRWLWTDFAREIGAVSDPSVPVGWIVVVALGAVLLANLVAAGPGRRAARTKAAVALRVE
jgi:hypothetical protein